MQKYFSYPAIAATSSGNLAVTSSSGGAGGTNATVTLAAPTSLDKRTLQSMVWNYTTTPSSAYARAYNGTSSGNLMFEVEIITQGLDGWVFQPPLKASPGNAITCILTQGGSSVIGRLNAYGPVEG